MMRRLLVAMGLAMAMAGRADAQWAVDQSSSTFWHFANPTPWLAQTFTPAVNNITGIEANMGVFTGDCLPGAIECEAPTFDVYLSLWTGAPDQQTSQMLAGDVVTFDNLGDLSRAALTFDAIMITPGATYWIVMGMPSSPAISWWFNFFDPYPRGESCSGGALITDTWSCAQDPSYPTDFDFTTYYDPTIVPEPAAWALLLAGLGVVALRRRAQG